MKRRLCPRCETNNYSGSCGKWKCLHCAFPLNDEHEVPLDLSKERSENDEAEGLF